MNAYPVPSGRVIRSAAGAPVQARAAAVTPRVSPMREAVYRAQLREARERVEQATTPEEKRAALAALDDVWTAGAWLRRAGAGLR